MPYTCFAVSIDHNIAHIVLNRPEKRNSMNSEFWDELPRIVEEIDSQSQARVIVISSTGPHFSSGLDINSFVTGGGGGEQPSAKQQRARGERMYQNIKHMQKTFTVLEDCRIPVLVAIQGGCIGGGVDFATACDIRYACQDTFFTIYEINIGMTADVGTFPRLVKLIPEGVVKELAYTGRRMSAEEAKSVGLANAVFTDQQTMLEEVMKVAAEIASKAPLAVAGCKRLINYSRDHSTADGLDYIGIWNASMLQPSEMLEAITANGEKRVGDFVDLPSRKAGLDLSS
ncbi:MAG: crotonase/enoyl-CoA hydratase family protein [bacterium]|nr:crotonase/enoyl-CoA hydratase family protein [Gammaproteobacteria bacterium]HIL94549.1 crotonase/enoyl-CoA hydratase family protein [Pseudomonadales bacterium]